MSRANKIIQRFDELSPREEDAVQKDFDQMKPAEQRRHIKNAMKKDSKLDIEDFDLTMKDLKGKDKLFFDSFPSNAREAIAKELLR